MDISYFLSNVYEFATKVCTIVKDTFVPSGYLRYVPDTNFVMCSYAVSCVLLKCMGKLQLTRLVVIFVEIAQA